MIPEGNSLFQIIFIFLRLLSQEQARRYVSLEVPLCHPSNIGYVRHRTEC